MFQHLGEALANFGKAMGMLFGASHTDESYLQQTRSYLKETQYYAKSFQKEPQQYIGGIDVGHYHYDEDGQPHWYPQPKREK